MSRESHLSAVYAAQLRLTDVLFGVQAAERALQVFDPLLITAVGETPGTDPGQQAATTAVLLRDTLADATRLTARIDELLDDYRRGI